MGKFNWTKIFFIFNIIVDDVNIFTTKNERKQSKSKKELMHK